MVFAYLTQTNGSRSGSNFILEAAGANRIGRGLDCRIVLSDPLSSRVHAVVEHRGEDGWWVRDSKSRNGTFLNGQKVDEARLAPGAVVRIGSTEFTFHESEDRPENTSLHSINLTQTVIRDAPVHARDAENFAITALKDPERAHDFLSLYQLCLSWLGCDEPDEIIATALQTLHQRTRASVSGFLWLTDDGQLKPQWVIPRNAAGKVELSESLTRMVGQQGRAVWIDNVTPGAGSKSLRHFADAICVPCQHDERPVGAVHMYLEQGRFRQIDFEFAISLGNALTPALQRARRQAVMSTAHRRLADKSAATDELIGDSKPMLDLKSRIRRLSRATGCVLIRGESGAGKELVARAIHRHSNRADRPLLSVNCAAIPRELMESQLFGHKKGAFTGAEADHRGWFEQAHTGTLFLDEVGELTLEGQAKLLRILEGHPFLPVGSTQEVTVDVRVIAATNRDLREFVREKRFREDLYYRLSVFELMVPPLRERGADMERLIQFFLDHFKTQHGRPEIRLSAAALQKLLSYNWPGNVRQLRNVMDSAVVLAEHDTIEDGDLGLRSVGGEELESLRWDYWEPKLIKEALTRTSGNVPEAARLMGIGRATMYRKIDEYGIKR